MKNLLTQFWNNEDGVTAIEYALIGVAMAAMLGVVVSGPTGLKAKLAETFKTITSTITSAATPSS